MTDWPDPYIDGEKNTPPSWRRAQTLDAGRMLANRMLNDRGFALSYLGVVKQFYLKPDDYTERFATLIELAYPTGDMKAFNANDFANVHRAAWLYLFQAFSCLVDKNLHGKHDDWGDPLPGAQTSNGKEQVVVGERVLRVAILPNVHNIPNATGYFALTSMRDVPAPLIDERTVLDERTLQQLVEEHRRHQAADYNP